MQCCYGVANGVRLAVKVGMTVGVEATVGVLGIDVFVGIKVAVNGRAVSVSGSVGYGEAVMPGNGVG